MNPDELATVLQQPTPSLITSSLHSLQSQPFSDRIVSCSLKLLQGLLKANISASSLLSLSDYFTFLTSSPPSPLLLSNLSRLYYNYLQQLSAHKALSPSILTTFNHFNNNHLFPPFGPDHAHLFAISFYQSCYLSHTLSLPVDLLSLIKSLLFLTFDDVSTGQNASSLLRPISGLLLQADCFSNNSISVLMPLIEDYFPIKFKKSKYVLSQCKSGIDLCLILCSLLTTELELIFRIFLIFLIRNSSVDVLNHLFLEGNNKGSDSLSNIVLTKLDQKFCYNLNLINRILFNDLSKTNTINYLNQLNRFSLDITFTHHHFALIPVFDHFRKLITSKLEFFFNSDFYDYKNLFNSFYIITDSVISILDSLISSCFFNTLQQSHQKGLLLSFTEFSILCNQFSIILAINQSDLIVERVTNVLDLIKSKEFFTLNPEILLSATNRLYSSLSSTCLFLLRKNFDDSTNDCFFDGDLCLKVSVNLTLLICPNDELFDRLISLFKVILVSKTPAFVDDFLVISDRFIELCFDLSDSIRLSQYLFKLSRFWTDYASTITSCRSKLIDWLANIDPSFGLVLASLLFKFKSNCVELFELIHPFLNNWVDQVNQLSTSCLLIKSILELKDYVTDDVIIELISRQVGIKKRYKNLNNLVSHNFSKICSFYFKNSSLVLISLFSRINIENFSNIVSIIDLNAAFGNQLVTIILLFKYLFNHLFYLSFNEEYFSITESIYNLLISLISKDITHFNSLIIPLVFCFRFAISFLPYDVSNRFNSNAFDSIFGHEEEYFVSLMKMIPNGHDSRRLDQNLLNLIDRSLLPQNFKFSGTIIQAIVLLINSRHLQLNCSVFDSFILLKEAFKLLLYTNSNFEIKPTISICKLLNSSSESSIVLSFLFSTVYNFIQENCLYSLLSVSCGRSIASEIKQWRKYCQSILIGDKLGKLIDLFLEGDMCEVQNNTSFHVDDDVPAHVTNPIYQSIFRNKVVSECHHFAFIYPFLFYPFHQESSFFVSKVINFININSFKLLNGDHIDLVELSTKIWSLNDVCVPVGSLFKVKNSQIFGLLALKLFESGKANLGFLINSKSFSPSFSHLHRLNILKTKGQKFTVNSTVDSDLDFLENSFNNLDIQSNFQSNDVTSTATNFVNQIQQNLDSFDSPLISLTLLPNNSLLFAFISADSGPLFWKMEINFQPLLIEFNSILEESLDLLQSSKKKNLKSESEKSVWWNKRYSQNQNLGELLSKFDENLGFLKYLFLPIDDLSQLLDSATLKLFSKTEKNEKLKEFLDFIKKCLYLLIKTGSTDLYSYLTKNFIQNLNLSQSCHDDLSLLISKAHETCQPKISTRPRSVSTPVICLSKDHSNFDSSHVFLILDSNLQCFPIESCPFFSSNSITISRFLNYDHFSLLKSNLDSQMSMSIVDPNSVYYCINPSGDLPVTTKSFNEFKQKLNVTNNWTGVVDTCHDPQMSLSNMSNHHVFLYCGHGAGENVFSKYFLPSTKSPYLIALMGCSSSKLIDYNYFDSDGFVLNYLAFGNVSSFLILGCLWDVTDKDLDRLTYDLLLSTFTTPTSPLELLPRSRNCCKLVNLTGSSVISWGFPIFIKNELIIDSFEHKTPKLTRPNEASWASKTPCFDRMEVSSLSSSICALDLSPTPKKKPRKKKEASTSRPVRRSARIASRNLRL
ncbi:hypothetical protein P9112_009789 [Eukaryota sp. TZLM1-RC]